MRKHRLGTPLTVLLILSSLTLCPLAGGTGVLTTALQAGIRSWTSSGPEGASVWAIGVAPTDNMTAYAVTGAGIFATADGGQTWNAANNGLTTSSIADVAVDPGNAVVVYAATDQGLFKTETRGRSWRLLRALGAPVTALALDPTRASSLYAIAHDDLYASIDGGETWMGLLAGGKQQGVRNTVTVHPVTGTVHTTLRGTVMSSTDHGTTWTSHSVPAVLPYQVMSFLTLDPSAPSTIYIGGGGGFFKSIDAGKTWSAINRGLPYDSDMGMYFLGNLIVDPSSSSRLFTTANNSVYRSDDQGATWTAIDIGSSTWVWNLSISTSPAMTMYAGTGGDGIFKTVDGGVAWIRAGHGLRAAVVNQVVATEPSTIVAATAAGVHRTTDGGLSWVRLDLLMDVLFLAVEPNDSQTMYAGSWSRLLRSRDGGQTWSVLRDVGFYDYMLTLIIDPADPATLYLGSGVAVSKSTDRGDTWAPIMKGLPDNVAAFSALTIDRAGVIYTGSSIGMYRSTNGGASWTRIGAGLPLQGSASRLLEVDPYDGSIYTSIANEGLFESPDSGDTWQSLAFSKQRVTALAIDPKSSSWYAATELGVLTSVDGGEHWTQMSEGLPVATITSLALDKSGKALHAGTQGAGVLDYEIASPLAIERLPDDATRLPRLLAAIANERSLPAAPGLSPQATRKSFFIAAAASSAGANGTFFRSDITLTNRTDHEQDVVVAWLAAAEEGTPPTFKIKLPAPAHRNGWFEAPPLTVTDFVRTLNLSGLGALVFIAVGPSGDLAADDASIAGYSRTWSPATDTRGTVSQALPGVDPLALTLEPHAMAVGFRQDANFRTNVGIVNLDTHARVFDCRAVGEGASAPFSVRVGPLSMKQLSLPPGIYGPLAIEVWAEHGEDTSSVPQYPWMLYGSTVDNVTGDGWTSTASPINER